MIATLVRSPVAHAGDAGATWRPIGALIGAVVLYTALLLPAARGNYAMLGATLHGFLAVSLFLAAIVGLIDAVGRRLLRSCTPFTATDLAWYLTAATIGGATIPIYGIFKQLLLPARGFPLDPALAAADRLLFLGHQPWEVTHAVLGTLWPTVVIDSAYSAAMILMVVFPILAIALVRTPLDRFRLLGCWLAGWIVVGTVFAWLLASAGPCYFDTLIAPNPGFRALGAHLDQLAAQARAHGLVIGARDFQPVLLAAQASGHYAPAGGISAAPSVHVTMATLFAIAGFRITRPVGWLVTGFAALIWIGSIHLGWHYAADGILGAAIMLLLWQTSAPIASWLVEGRPSASLAAPARAVE